jgi:hypothetical protein
MTLNVVMVRVCLLRIWLGRLLRLRKQLVGLLTVMVVLVTGVSAQTHEQNLRTAKIQYGASSHDEAARVRYVTKLAEMWAQVAPKILHNPDLDAKIAYANEAYAIEEELRKHPMPRNVDSKTLSQLLIGEWQSPRHTYVFRADGTYGVADEDRYKWRIDGTEYIDDVTRGPIILLDRNYFIYACGHGVIVYIRANSTSSGNADARHRPSYNL